MSTHRQNSLEKWGHSIFAFYLKNYDISVCLNLTEKSEIKWKGLVGFQKNVSVPSVMDFDSRVTPCNTLSRVVALQIFVKWVYDKFLYYLFSRIDFSQTEVIIQPCFHGFELKVNFVCVRGLLILWQTFTETLFLRHHTY